MSIISLELTYGHDSAKLDLPATAAELNQALMDIDALDKQYYISDCKADINATYETIRSFFIGADINAVNYLAAKLDDLPPEQLEKLKAVMESPMRFKSIIQLIDYADNTDYFVLTPGISNAEELGRYVLYESDDMYIREEWKSGIDPERLGKRVAEDEKGVFTSHGYLQPTGDEWKKIFERTGEIPPEYRIENYSTALRKYRGIVQDEAATPAPEPTRRIMGVYLECGLNRTPLALPATGEELKDALENIGGLNKPYIIVDYWVDFDAPYDGVRNMFLNTNIDELNYLAARLAGLPPPQLETLAAIMESPGAMSTNAEIIDFTYNPDFHILLPDVHNTEDLAQHYIFESGLVNMPQQWKNAIDLYAFGTNLEEQNVGVHTSRGFLLPSGDPWNEVYEKTGEIPPEYRITNYLKTAEMSVEGNYNQVDGIINNEPPRRADLTDGQTHDEIKELAPETLPPKDKPSILGKLAEATKEAAEQNQPGKAKDKKQDIDL